jgi:integrase
MPTDAKPLFRPDALRPKLSAFSLPAAATSARPKLGHWTDLLSSKAAEKMKETELLGDFIRDVFGDLLGYAGPASGSPVYTLKRESLVQVDGKFADAALGRFTLADGQADFVLVIEGKGPRDPLDRPFGSRKRSAVEQALQYAVNLQIDWFLVTNMRETRLFHKGHDLFTYERFETATLAHDDAALKRFAYLLGAERVIPAAGGTHLDALLADSHRIGRELTNDYYHEYATLRRQTFHELRRVNPDVPPAEMLVVAQKILDRVLFIAFSEDRGLLPAKSIANAFRHADPYNPRPIWDNFRGLFRAIDEGNPALAISRYNGGLFAPDELLEKLRVPDVVCKGFDKLAAYEYGKDADNPNAKMIDVEILGHIFEQSISDLEELHQQITAPAAAEAEPAKAGPSKRKKEGAFYTPAFVTRYIVSETLQPILADRFDTLRRQYEDEAKAGTKKLFADPRAYDLRELTGPQRKALADFWNAWLDALATVRIVDPACGSGAFLLEAFDQMHVQYQQANASLTELVNQQLFADVDKQILQSNLFGMDLNTEAIEICRLSLWIKTAERDKILTSLDDNIKQGNSVIGEPSPLDAWRQRFPAATADGGFDVVIGNPPYVRQEWIAKDKPFLQQHYRAYDGVADLYVYFYELGMKLLKPGGRLGFITQVLIGETVKDANMLDRAMNRAIEVASSVVMSSPAAPQTYALEPNSKRFLELERAKNNKPRTYGELSESITAIIRTTFKGQAILAPTMDVRKIDKTTVENIYLFLRNESKREPAQQKKQFGFFKRLIRYLWQSDLIELPKNLDAENFVFNVTAKKVKEYDKAEINALLTGLPDRLKLYALLGLNCGMLTIDIGSLRKDEMDMESGRIRRKRTKTEGEKNVPEVDYQLWPITFKLLKKCLSADPVLALTTKNGKPLVTYWIDADGKEKEKNMVRQQWKRAQTEIPHKAFRSIGATVLGAETPYRFAVPHYLGHSPKSIADKSYVAPSRSQFDEIVTWLGKQFKIGR